MLFICRKVEKSNSVFAWDDPAAYKANANSLTTPQKPADFWSRLNQQVTTIDFNNFEPTPPQLVSIHKRERTSPLFSTAQISPSPTGLKKRKYRLVPNNNTLDFDASTSIHQPQPAVSEPLNDLKQTLPEDRKELLKLVSLRT